MLDTGCSILDKSKKIPLDYVKARDLHHHVGKQVTSIGWQITEKTVHTIHGELVKFVSFEDQTGIYETVLFPKVYNRFCHMLNGSRPCVPMCQIKATNGPLLWLL